MTIIVPYTAGGGTDLLTRALEKRPINNSARRWLSPICPVPAARWPGTNWPEPKQTATPSALLQWQWYYSPCTVKPRYHYATALDPIAQLASYPVIVAVRSDQPWQNLSELLEYAKSHPGEIKFGHGGIGTAHHIFGEIFARETGINIAQVPFRGDAESLAALLGGHIQIAFIAPTSAKEHVKSGSLRILAVAGDKRLADPALAAVPHPSRSRA